MSLRVKEVSVTPRATFKLFRFEVSIDFDINNDVALTSLLSNGTPFNMSTEEFVETCNILSARGVDCADVFVHDREKDETRDFIYT